MIILVLNAGSSSLKFSLINIKNEQSIANGIAERIGIPDSCISLSINNKKYTLNIALDNHYQALEVILKQLQQNILTNNKNIFAIGHRVVHGGPKFNSSEIITETILHEIEKLSPYAPLHNPASVLGINITKTIFPNIPQVAIFDTSFHSTMPNYAYTYGLPYKLSEKFGLRRYGFHGTSHNYIAQQTAQLLNNTPEKMKIITCHIGNGSSISAIQYGKSIDTSMGLTPLEGVVMGTRCGNLDPGIIISLMEQENLDINKIANILNKQSGLLGISGISSDYRELLKHMEKNNRAYLAMKTLWYGILKYIGSYAAVMNGVDAIAFSAGIGENSPQLRSWICSHLTFLGIEIDEILNNKQNKKDFIISKPESKIKAVVIHTNEELMIARETYNTVINISK